MKKKIDQIIIKLRENKPLLEEKYGVKNLGVKVDLVMKDTLKPRIKDRVLKEAIPIRKLNTLYRKRLLSRCYDKGYNNGTMRLF